jgi:hypothetical protein
MTGFIINQERLIKRASETIGLASGAKYLMAGPKQSKINLTQSCNQYNTVLANILVCSYCWG